MQYSSAYYDRIIEAVKKQAMECPPQERQQNVALIAKLEKERDRSVAEEKRGLHHIRAAIRTAPGDGKDGKKSDGYENAIAMFMAGLKEGNPSRPLMRENKVDLRAIPHVTIHRLANSYLEWRQEGKILIREKFGYLLKLCAPFGNPTAI